MFFSGRSKQLPFLSDYLQEVAKRENVDQRRLGFAGAIIGVTAGLMGAAFGALAGTGVIQFGVTNIAVWMGLNLLTLAGFGAFYLSERKRRVDALPNKDVFRDAKPFINELNGSLQRRRLHRELSPTAGALLEEAARNWRRVISALATPFWTDPELPEHWKSIRDHAFQSADRAMLELLLLLKSCYQPNAGPQGWQSVVIDVVEQFGGTVNITRGEDLLPVTFDEATETVTMLSHLADEVESASKELIASGVGQEDHLRSRLAMTQTLNELRMVREAEQELEQNTLGE
ncbi:MAG: hypothetical protein IT363_12760 [Methanoregulaceae archaeon]|nr:hypothetical protein [Methanoregulaceae archaeon]